MKLHVGTALPFTRWQKLSPDNFKKMTFGDLKTKSGLEALNAYLENKSYIEGCVLMMYISNDLIDSSFPRVIWKRLEVDGEDLLKF